MAAVETAHSIDDVTESGPPVASSEQDLLAAVCEATLRAVGADALAILRADQETLRFVPEDEDEDADANRTFRAIASLPLLARGQSWGVVELYRTAARPWTEPDLALARLFADAVASCLVLAAERDAWQLAWQRAEHTATHDLLTGLPGRGLLFDRLDHAIANGARDGQAVAVVFVDVDDFKAVNDALGHAAGDAALIEVAHRLALTLRANDTLARLSGDEFVIICEHLDITAGHIHDWLSRLGERILRELRRPARPGETEIDVSVSMGAAVTTRECSAQTLTRRADVAMYAAKRSGGGRLVVGRMHPPARRRD